MKKFALENSKDRYEWNRPGRRRLGLDMPIEIHERLYEVCRVRNVTVSKYVMRLIIDQLNQGRNMRDSSTVVIHTINKNTFRVFLNESELQEIEMMLKDNKWVTLENAEKFGESGTANISINVNQITYIEWL